MVTKETGTNQVLFLYNGRDGVVTDENGPFYMRARYYSPQLKRFLNADVLVGNINKSATLNRYAYAEGNPISYIDPFGLSAEPGSNWVDKVSEVGHGILDLFGMLFVAGAVADGINALWYLVEGDMVNASLSATALIPVIGDAAGATKITGKVATKYGDDVLQFFAKYGDDVVSGADEAAEAVQNTIKNTSSSTTLGDLVDDKIDDVLKGGSGSTLFETFGVQPGRNVDLNNPSALNNRSYITYIFKNQSNEIVYVGRASGKGNPVQVMEGRISRGHDHFKQGYSYEIVATQTNKLANQGAEEFFILGYQEMGMQLENITPALSYRSDRVGKTMNKIEAFFEDLFR